jgi:hypothetical protein
VLIPCFQGFQNGAEKRRFCFPAAHGAATTIIGKPLEKYRLWEAAGKPEVEAELPRK